MFHFSNKQHSLRFNLDLLCIVFCYAAGIMAAKHTLLPLRLSDFIFLYSLFACWYYSALTNRLYAGNMGNVYKELLKTLYNIIFQIIFVALVYYLLDRPEYLKGFSFFYLASLIIILFSQKIFVNAMRRLKVGGKKKTNVLLIGSGKLGMKFYRYVKNHPGSGYHIIGVLDDQPPSKSLNGDYLGNVHDLPGIFRKITVHEVVVALPNTAVKTLEDVMRFSKNEAVHVKFLPDDAHFSSPGFTAEKLGDMLVINPRSEPLEALHRRAVKRSFDILFSAAALVLLCSWLFPLIAIMIKLSSKGPVFFKQLRSGKNTVPFYCYKFRSMWVNEDADLKKAVRNDPRVTLVGKILRKTNLDELPQFWNVLTGTMSVVGPRPHMVSQNGPYAKIISQYMVRQLIKPGVTGWAQVSGYRGETKIPEDMQNRIAHDVWYLENWSFELDVKIIFLTVRNMIKGEENAF